MVLKASEGDGERISNSYTMGCPPVRGDNPRALASGLSYVHLGCCQLQSKVCAQITG